MCSITASGLPNDSWMQTHSRIVVSHAPPESYAPMARALLQRLGYELLSPEEFEELAEAQQPKRPDVRIVDERQLGEVPDELEPTPIVVLSGEFGVTGADSRIVGAVRRPAGMHELYRLIQQVTEPTPRETPRVPTHLQARCRLTDRDWQVSILSLSENGCLVRSPESLPLGASLELDFELPRTERLHVVAEAGYQLLPDVGLLFRQLAVQQRRAIQAFVSFALQG